MKEDTIKSLNIEAGGCNKGTPQSTKDVLIHAINDPNTRSIEERTNCTFQCQKGYFDETVGDKIPFKCVPNPDRTDPLGTKNPPYTVSRCVICVLAFSITFIILGAGWVRRYIIINRSSLIFSLNYFLTVFCSANVQGDSAEDP